MSTPASPLRIVLKAALLFVLVNLLFAAFDPMPALGKLSLYNGLLPGRERLPYGDDPGRAYNLSLYSLKAMFASHQLHGTPKAANEYRVLLIGDSSVWGYLLENKDTLTSALNAAGLQAADGRRAVFYNLGHPTISLSKDLLILDYAMHYQPDLVIWPLTLEAFPLSKQVSSPLLQHNPQRAGALILNYDLPLDPADSAFVRQDAWGASLLGQRRNLADLLRLQLYGVLWAATGVDVHIPEQVERHAIDLEADERYGEFLPPELPETALALDVLAAGIQRAGETPVLLINEPMFVSRGANSDIRYNSFYPRWAYDQYRQWLQAEAERQAWHYADLWQAVDNDQFTNTPIHLTPAGTQQLAQQIATALAELFDLEKK
ncbi:MAG: SGNH/GDSL hydrolase family protein [Anaerolineales bacterium]|nr:SGNH/GDSL hydrolase family protein [Anaerolineales bacterium]